MKDGQDINDFWRSFLVDLLVAIAAVIVGRLTKIGLDYLKKLLSKDEA